MRQPGLPFIAAMALWAGLVSAQQREVVEVAMPTEDDGKPIRLLAMVYRPQTKGEVPLLIFNHGSRGNGGDASMYPLAYDKPEFAAVFNREGWAVAFLQRRGRGGSGGLYDEGHAADRSRYSCEPARSLEGVERALADLAAAVDHFAAAGYDRARIVVGGQSRGGALAVAYAGDNPTKVRGVLNFAGGWLGQRCKGYEEVNRQTLLRGTPFAGPSLWLYGENDSFYGAAHVQAHAESYNRAGGQARLVLHDLGQDADGHRLIDDPRRWTEAALQYLRQVGR